MTHHLLQSTVFAAFAALLALALKNNSARVRYWLWLAASVKFLIPFSFLISAGSQLHWREAAPPTLSYVMENVSRRLAAPELQVAHTTAQSPDWAAIAPIVWLVGCAIVLAGWAIRWRRVRYALRSASPLWSRSGVDAMSTAALLEPGVFGIRRPILLLPNGITEKLTEEQLDAIVAHELCHVRRRDNLTAAIHMLVEALFWFHPLVWWIGARMVEERERACDEAVLQSGNEPEVYAEGILRVCRLYLESPLECVSGVTGSDLKKRIEGIMSHRGARELDFVKRALLITAGFAALAAPVVVGIWNAPPLKAQIQPRLAFEVISVKPSDSNGRGISMDFSPSGRFTSRGIPLLFLVATAYGVPFQGARAPSGLDEKIGHELYDVEATAPEGSIPPGTSERARTAKMKLMLQSLLEDRFHLKARLETKVAPVYAIVVGKNGPKLKKAQIEEKDCGTDAGKGVDCHGFHGGMGRGLHAKAISITDIANAVSNWADRPVVDRTGIEGLYEIETEGWTPMLPRPQSADSKGDEGINDPTRPTLYMVFDRLGLKMESSKAPLDYLVVEHVERPTSN